MACVGGGSTIFFALGIVMLFVSEGGNELAKGVCAAVQRLRGVQVSLRRGRVSQKTWDDGRMLRFLGKRDPFDLGNAEESVALSATTVLPMSSQLCRRRKASKDGW